MKFDLNLILIGMFLAFNLISFFMFGIDKWKAKRDAYRISEGALIASACLFSSYGAILGMYCFHHKTRKIKFLICIPLLLIIHTFLIYQFFFA